MRLSRPVRRQPSENTIPLINVVFLMLIFFLIAGTVAPSIDTDVTLITTEDAEQTEAPNALFVTAEGILRWQGEIVDGESFASRWLALDEGGALQLAADRDLPAVDLIDIVTALRVNGVEAISVVTERAAP